MTAAFPDDGIHVLASDAEDPAQARHDLIGALDLSADAFLVIVEDGHWFARWDPPATGRPPTAAPRRRGS